MRSSPRSWSSGVLRVPRIICRNQSEGLFEVSFGGASEGLFDASFDAPLGGGALGEWLVLAPFRDPRKGLFKDARKTPYSPKGLLEERPKPS